LKQKGFSDCKRCFGQGYYNSSVDGHLKSCEACVEKANDCTLCSKSGFWLFDRKRRCGCKFGRDIAAIKTS